MDCLGLQHGVGRFNQAVATQGWGRARKPRQMIRVLHGGLSCTVGYGWRQQVDAFWMVET